MTKPMLRFGCLCAIVCLASTSARAQFNGLSANPRVFNDFSTSSLTINNSNSIPGSVTIDDRNLVDDGMGGNFANRHDVLLSENNGASPAIQLNSEPFTISTVLTLTVGSTAPRKEAGLRINSSPASGVGDTLFLVNSDAREIVAFGGGASFFSFGSGATGYTLGSPILMGMTYTPGSPSTLEYFIDRDPSTPGGIESSGPLPYSNLENGPVDYQVGVYGQVSPANAQDFIRAEFASINAVIPEPASAGVALAGLAAIGALRRRR